MQPMELLGPAKGTGKLRLLRSGRTAEKTGGQGLISNPQKGTGGATRRPGVREGSARTPSTPVAVPGG